MSEEDGSHAALLAEIHDLRERLREAEETLDAIRSGAVDAVIVGGPDAPQVFTLEGADQAYRVLVERMNEGAGTLGSDGTVLYCNSALAKILKSPISSIVGTPMRNFVTAQDRDRFEILLEQGLRESAKDEIFLNGEGGRSVPVHLSCQTSLIGDVRAISMVVTDITEARRLQKEREKLIKVLEAKNAELERFVYSVSHDLRSPLITIQTFLGFVAQDAADQDTERLKADMERINRAAEKMGNLLNEVLELSRIGRMVNPPSEVTAIDLANEALELLTGSIAQHGAEVYLAPDLPILYGDRPRLQEVFQNLIENAAKFMGNQPHPRIEMGVRTDGVETVLFVRDNGIGIDPAYHERVFGLFDKLDQNTEGSGVGLAIVKRIVEVHGGRIWVESEGVGQGSTFCLTLPHPHLHKR
jgi:PAS domain S-box-containing protein